MPVDLLVVLSGRKLRPDSCSGFGLVLDYVTFSELPSLGLTVDESRIDHCCPESWSSYKHIGERETNANYSWYNLPVIPCPLPSSNSSSESVSLTHEP